MQPVVTDRASLTYLSFRNQSTYTKKYVKPTRVCFISNRGLAPKLKLSVSSSSQRQIVALLAKPSVNVLSASPSSSSRRQTVRILAKEHVDFTSLSSSVSSSSQRENVHLLAKEHVDFTSLSSPVSLSSQRQNIPLLDKEPEDFASLSPSVSLNSQRQKVPLLDKEPEDFASSGSSFFGERLPLPLPLGLTRQRRPMYVKAYKNNEHISRMNWSGPKERPEWFWRTLACLPYLLSFKTSEIGFFMSPFLQLHGGAIGETILNLLPGPTNSLQSNLFNVYTVLGCGWLVKNKHLPHYLRFHLVMGMLLDAAIQIFWRTSQFFPLINFGGRLAMYHYMVMGFCYSCVLLECLRCAIAGAYPQVPIFSEAAYLQTGSGFRGGSFDGFKKPKARRF